MKRILLILIFFTSWFGFGQSITVNSTTYTVPQLVNDVLFGAGAGGGSCAGTISNITWRTGNTNGFGSVNGIGYFQNTNPNFPLSAGVVMTSGDLNDADGPNTSNSSGGNGAWTGDAQLFSYIQGLGFDTGLTSYNNASVIEFDFVPLSPSFSFDFMFASEEYGTYQCQFSDAFAFFLTNVTAGTPATNIALIPSTTTPISVLTVRNNLHNPACSSVNPAFFDKFYQLPSGLNPADSPTNFNGQTVLLTAAATVIPNNTYHIKLVVADRNDNILDSAVFLGAGSFDIGQASISGTVQGGADFSDIIDFSIANSNAICQGDTRTVKAGTAAITGANYQWSVGGVPIPGATSFQYTITAPGTYQVSITYSSGCVITDSILAEYLPAVPLALPNNLTNCSNPSFNLAQNTPVVLNGLNPSNYDINYFTTLTNAEDFTAPIANLSSFPGTNGQTIYIRVDDSSGSGCFEILTFTLTITPPPTPPNPSDVTSCNSYTLPALAANETYHTASGGSPSTQIAAGTVITTSQTIYIYVQSAPGCTAEGDFVVTIITGTPPNPSDVTVCGSYTLPALPAGSTYHSASGGSTATLLPVGTVLTTSQIVYVVSQSSGTPSCSAEGDFALTVNTAPVTPNPADVTACDSYVLPVLPAGQSYHSAAGGSPATQIPAGTVITTNQTIYIFAQSGTVPNCTAEGDFTVTINLTPATPNPADVTVCNSYILPALPAGSSYHTLPNGGGTTLLAGATITTTQVIYVFAQTGTTPNCTSEGDFLVTVNNTPVP
ncbi:choice-of-anchor L domain-containing protein, partial [Flavobacterium sp.]|uniref:choice-of-anchor L domain-containing protein n=1 Tax=Flavobacterium sp. TaxID=239 RepID=UPI000ECD45D1